MDMRRIQHEVQVEEWKKQIIACRNSGLPVIRWCKENAVKENRYYYWLNVIRNETLVKRQAPKTTGLTVFAEVNESSLSNQHAEQTTGICAVIRLSGLSVEIHNGASQSTIAAIMGIVKSSC